MGFFKQPNEFLPFEFRLFASVSIRVALRVKTHPLGVSWVRTMKRLGVRKYQSSDFSSKALQYEFYDKWLKIY